MHRLVRHLLLSSALLIAGLGLGTSVVGAENLGPGGGTRVIVGDEVVGPYRLLITSSPEPAQVGIVTYVVRISDPASGDKVRDADVAIELVHGEDGSILNGSATHKDSGNAVDYAAHMQIEKPGVYNGKVRITGPAGPAEVVFTQRVLTQRRFGTLLLIGLPFLVVLGILAGVWLRRPGSRQPGGTEGQTPSSPSL